MKNFNDLNEYIIQEIFNYLDGEHLKHCTLVCKLWNEIISNYSSTMYKMKFVLDGDFSSREASDRIQRIAKAKRKIYRLSIRNVTFSSNAIEKVKSISRNVHILKVSGTLFENESQFYDFLLCFEKLEKISLFQSKILKTPEGSTSPSRKTRKFSPMDFKILILSIQDGFIAPLTKLGVQSQKIIIDCDHYRESGEQYINSITDFLGQQRNLLSLAIKTYGKDQQSNLFKKLAQETKNIKIQKLAVTMKIFSTQIWETDDFVNLVDFLRNLKTSLKDLELYCKLLPCSIFQLLIGEMKIEKLIIRSYGMTSNLVFKPGTRNVHLKTLICIHPLPTPTAILLFRAFPSITNLLLNDDGPQINENLIAISQNLETLAHLEISDLTLQTPEAVIPTLKFLQFQYVERATEESLTFINANPSIETLMLKWPSPDVDWNFEQVEFLTRNLINLKRLVFGPSKIEVNSRMLEMLNRNCPKLTSVEIFKPFEECTSKTNTSLRNVSITDYESLELVELIFKNVRSIWYEDKEFNVELVLGVYDEEQHSVYEEDSDEAEDGDIDEHFDDFLEDDGQY